LDFMRLLKSFEELLYELVTWILFYPLTLWRSVRHPLKMMAYAEAELSETVAEQYDDALSPPIFLLITLFIAHLIELRLSPGSAAVLPEVFQDERNLLFFRAIAFSVFPLFFGLLAVRQRGAKLTRQKLKPAFYSQCYTAAPTILSIDLALIIGKQGTQTAAAAGIAIFVIGLTWYIAAETTWFAGKGGMSKIRAFLLVTGTVLLGFIAIFAVTLVTALAVSKNLLTSGG